MFKNAFSELGGTFLKANQHLHLIITFNNLFKKYRLNFLRLSKSNPPGEIVLLTSRNICPGSFLKKKVASGSKKSF
jgi:hypothetical protein